MKAKHVLFIVLFATYSAFSQNNTTNKNDSSPDEVEMIMVVESMPEFKGGFEALMKYLNQNAVYTEKAKKEKIKGKVFVNFYVETDGSVSNPRILRGLHPDLDSISLSIVKNMPKWIPAKQRGKPVKCSYNLPIAFDYEKPANIIAKHSNSKYWHGKGKNKFMKLCTGKYRKSQEECNCWYNFIKFEYNNYKLKELDLESIFKNRKCK